MKFQEIEGNIIELAQRGEFDVIIQGNNCFCTQSSGLAPQMVKAFQTDKFPMEQTGKGDYNKLGQIDYKIKMTNSTSSPHVAVVNCYTQYYYGNQFGVPLDYDALRLCLRKINHIFKGKRIGTVLIGCGLGGGLWDYNSVPKNQILIDTIGNTNFDDFPFVKEMILEELKDMEVTVVHFKP